MSRGLPERGDPLRLAELDRAFEGELPLEAFRRLAGSIEQARDSAWYRLRFERDRKGRAWVHGRVRTSLPLTCQRCLGAFGFPVERQWRLALIREPAEEALLAEGEDAFLVTDPGMRLAELVEDELILALPLVPLHADYERCTLPENPAADEPEPEAGAFAELVRLRREN